MQKTKSAPLVVGFDYRLGKVFKFTADQLAANQNGQTLQKPFYIFGVPLAQHLYRLFGFKRKHKWVAQPPNFHAVCGKAHILREIIKSGPEGPRDAPSIKVRFVLAFPGHEIRFHISEQQANAISEGTVYRVYYLYFRYGNEILSIEVPSRGCQE